MKRKNLSSRCFSRVCQHAHKSIKQKELLVWGLSPMGVEPTTDCLGGDRSILLSYGTIWLKPFIFQGFQRFR